MADGRFLAKSIAHSAQLACLPDRAELLFYRMLPHLDCEGRLAGEPKLVKAIAVPLKDDYTVEVVTELLYLLAETKDEQGTPLIYWFEARGKRVVEFPAFATHQKGLRKDRESATRLPAYADGGVAVARRQRPRPTPATSRRRSAETAEEIGVSEVKSSLSQVEGEVEVKIVGPSAQGIPGGWPAEFVVMYEPIGLLVPGRLGRTLKPVVDRYGLSVTREMWEFYIRLAPHLKFGKLDPEVRDTSRMSPDDFVRNAGTWYEKTQPLGGASAVAAN